MDQNAQVESGLEKEEEDRTTIGQNAELGTALQQKTKRTIEPQWIRMLKSKRARTGKRRGRSNHNRSERQGRNGSDPQK